jgi:Uma2 family endonuclease
LPLRVDDGIVVVMSEHFDVNTYLAGPENLRRRELVWGVVREPPAPKYGHQSVVTRATVILDLHVRERQLGIVCVSPIDVVLDEKKALIVQPDVVFLSNERRSILRDELWGAPDLVIEVTSRGTARYDRHTKMRWYREYGVRECWLLDIGQRLVTIVDLRVRGPRAWRRFSGDQRLHSTVLTQLTTEAASFFA